MTNIMTNNTANENDRQVVIVLETNGKIRLHTVADNSNILPDLQALVDGYIEVLPVLDPRDNYRKTGLYVVVNEEGMIKGLPLNPIAPFVLHIAGFIAGTAGLAVEKETEHGERDLYGMSVQQAEQVIKNFSIDLTFLYAEDK